MTFLALLELMRQNLVALFQKERFGPIHITSRMLAGDDAETAGDARTGPANEPEDEGKSGGGGGGRRG
ncbi:MAG: hypothetical protein M5R36_27245 [Deltaproteobacteria bacterium]|nr:hypothetical protein [Deltaproteobacteria bacterium]